MTPGAICLNKTWKETRSGLCRASFRRPPLSGPKTFTVMSPLISNIYARKRSNAKKLIFTIRAIMIGQQIDLLQVISLEQHGDAATETTSVLSSKLFGPYTIVGTRIDSKQLG